jgi:hypothetical protein
MDISNQAALLARLTRANVAAGGSHHGLTHKAVVQLQETALRQAAKAMGLWMANPYQGRHPENGGQEHDVWFDAEQTCVWKLTKPGSYGLLAGSDSMAAKPLDYLVRLCLTEVVLGFPWRLWGVSENHYGKIQIITCQPWVEAQKSSDLEIQHYLQRLDFSQSEEDCTVWEHPDGWVLMDAYGDNILVSMDHAVMYPLDLPIGHIRGADAFLDLIERSLE